MPSTCPDFLCIHYSWSDNWTSLCSSLTLWHSMSRQHEWVKVVSEWSWRATSILYSHWGDNTPDAIRRWTAMTIKHGGEGNADCCIGHWCMWVCVRLSQTLHLIKLEGTPFQLKHGGGGREERMKERDERRRGTVLKQWHQSSKESTSQESGGLDCSKPTNQK